MSIKVCFLLALQLSCVCASCYFYLSNPEQRIGSSRACWSDSMCTLVRSLMAPTISAGRWYIHVTSAHTSLNKEWPAWCQQCGNSDTLQKRDGEQRGALIQSITCSGKVVPFMGEDFHVMHCACPGNILRYHLIT